MSIIRRIPSNPTLRNLYRKTFRIANKKEVGDVIMCPCGCLQMFKKANKNNVFAATTGSHNHKNNFYSRVRSKSNYAFTDKMLNIEIKMNRYIANNLKFLEKKEVKEFKPEPLKTITDDIKNNMTVDNYIELMKTQKSINSNKKVGDEILCPCGCNELIKKRSYQQVYSQSKTMDLTHKNNYYNITRGDTKININDNKTIKSFKILKENIEKENSLKNKVVNNKKNKQRRKI